MIDKLAADPTANVATLIRNESQQVNEDTMTSLPETQPVSKARPHGPTPLRASGAQQSSNGKLSGADNSPTDPFTTCPPADTSPAQPEYSALPNERELLCISLP